MFNMLRGFLFNRRHAHDDMTIPRMERRLTPKEATQRLNAAMDDLTQTITRIHNRDKEKHEP